MILALKFPKVSALELVPVESGLQFLRLPDLDFEKRCLAAEGVTSGQVSAVRAQLWKMHVDSQQNHHKPKTTKNSKNQKLKQSATSGQSQSRDSAASGQGVSFQSRIHAGMVVSWETPPDSKYSSSHSVNLAVILCPSLAFGSTSPHVDSESGNVGSGQSVDSDSYLCALVSPAGPPELYTVDIWTQIIIGRAQMKSQVHLKYDAATRYYRVVP